MRTKTADLEAALSAVMDDRDRLLHELAQIVRDLAGHDDPEVAAVVARASNVLQDFEPADDGRSAECT